jgi:archaellum component FlaG (FlaF/FlaG flagellin family)
MATLRKRLAICVKNTGYEASLETRKIYQVIADARAARHELVRVIDESGEDYLYPQSFFASISLPQQLRKAVLAAA